MILFLTFVKLCGLRLYIDSKQRKSRNTLCAFICRHLSSDINLLIEHMNETLSKIERLVISM